ncbi:MAG: peptidase T [Planctomycetota bacterium]
MGNPTTITDEMRQFMEEDARARLLRYVQIFTTSDENSESDPSTARQMDLLRLLAAECTELGLADVSLSDTGYVYATLPAPQGVAAPAIGLLAHVDTSPEQPGENVRPVCHENWDGSPISFADDPQLQLTPADCEELSDFVGDTIITASGKTLLGADNKAGISEIMAAIATLQRYPELPHAEIRLCFTSDEEIGRGTQGIDLGRLPTYCYTIDGGYPGELEAECFNAWRADLTFHGVGVHAGYAKDKLVNAIMIAARFLDEIPEEDCAENSDGRQGFYYVFGVNGDTEKAEVQLIIRDFERAENERRCQYLETLKTRFEKRYPRLRIDLEMHEQYRNMRDILEGHPRVVELAHAAIEDAGVEVLRRAIRGGTDGSLLTQVGHPTPNIFTGGMLFHSRKEWIASSSLRKATETIVHLARHWAQQ